MQQKLREFIPISSFDPKMTKLQRSNPTWNNPMVLQLRQPLFLLHFPQDGAIVYRYEIYITLHRQILVRQEGHDTNAPWHH